MAVKLRTGNTGEAITSAADGRLYASIEGTGSYVTSIGERCKASLDGPNSLIVQNGCIFHNGRFIDLEGNTTWTIPSGVQAQKRSNLCVVRTIKEADGSEHSEAVTLTGEATPDGTPEDPEYNDESLLEGATVSDFPLYRVVTDGINALDPVPLFNVSITMAELKELEDERWDSISQEFSINDPGGRLQVGLANGDPGLVYYGPKGDAFTLSITADAHLRVTRRNGHYGDWVVRIV